MKKLLTLFVVFAGFLSASAQIAPGSTAPDFVAKDINGRTWHLYDILESGRPVIMDVSATWCGPCWSYHNGGALETYYAAHGPEGDGKSMVFFDEGDASTNLNCLYGTSGCVGGTQGNWALNTPYPIFDNATIASDYQIGYYPTVYLICPDKTVREVGQLSAANLWAQASPCAVNIPANWGKITSIKAGARSLQLCGSQRIKPEFDMANLGTDPITSMKVELRWYGAVIQSKEFTDEINVLDGFHVDFDSLDVASAGVLAAEIVTINGQPNGAVSTQEINVTDAEQEYTGNKIEVRIRADVNAKDIFWCVYDENGQIFDQGGNLAVGPGGGGLTPNGSPASPSAYANNANIRDTITVPGSCFTFQLVDGAGNGLLAPGNIKLYTLGGTSFEGFSNNFGSYLGKAFAQSTSGVNTINPVNDLSIFPNPVSESLTITYDLGISTEVNVQVLNALGQTVISRDGKFVAAGPQQTEIPVNTLSNGLYFLQIQTTDGSVQAKPFVVAH